MLGGTGALDCGQRRSDHITVFPGGRIAWTSPTWAGINLAPAAVCRGYLFLCPKTTQG